MAGKIKQQLGGEMEIDKVRVRDDLEEEEVMSWMGRKLFMYNVTLGLYGLDWSLSISAPLKSRVLLPGNGKPEAIPWYVALS
uniref:Uncharacterized protein n=1 Tax=Oryza barthii TaxID=65489 RepID=A0A0D3GQG8_9ORYZ